VEETNIRVGDGRRLVLGFDAGCTTCSGLAKRIEEIVGDKLEVRNLREPQVEHWREQALGVDAPWAPTLIEIDGKGVSAWTGARMGVKLAKVLGLILTLRLMQIMVAARSVLPAVSPDVPVPNDPPGYGINRGQFIRRLGSGAVAASVAVSGIGGLSSTASAANRTSTSARGLRDCFATAAERRQFDRAVEILAEHIRVGRNGTLQISDGRFADAIKTGQEEGVPREMFRELASSVDIANEQILEGNLYGGSKLISPGIQQVTDQEARLKDPSAASGQTSARACRGRSGRSVHWWGIRMRLNSCQANTLIYYCTIEAGAATLCSKIWIIPCKIAAFVLLVQCATFQRAAAPGRGIVIDKSWSLRLPRVYSQ
jgi:hypothetical protein